MAKSKGDNLTIKEVKDKKSKMELDILKIIQDFEKECGVYTSYISMDRKGDDSPVPETRGKGPIKNVEVSMDLDLIY